VVINQYLHKRFRLSRKLPALPCGVNLGKVPASLLTLHQISLPRAVNDGLQERISGGRMTQNGRYGKLYITANTRLTATELVIGKQPLVIPFETIAFE
jgi:hypothetical protein